MVNRYSGLAIEGFDPVAYFADARPVLGLPDFEASQAGAVWRFRNASNRASFVAHPDIYGPQFGGYDPIDLARGVTFAGNPRFWLVSGERLYLFGREQSRDAFAADPAAAAARGQRSAGRSWSRRWRSRVRVASQPRLPFGIAPGDEFRHDEILPPDAEMQGPPLPSVTLPPAAVTTAWPAAMSHSQVGARRG